jgi:hypothetical protein
MVGKWWTALTGGKVEAPKSRTEAEIVVEGVPEVKRPAAANKAAAAEADRAMDHWAKLDQEARRLGDKGDLIAAGALYFEALEGREEAYGSHH